MKKLVLLLFFPVLLIAQSEVAEIEWLTDYDTALQNAQNEKKNLLVYFTGSDWCPPCKMLKSDFFETEEFKALSTKYVMLYVDLPRSRTVISSDQRLHNQKLLGKLNKRGVFPFIIIINENEKVLDEISGYNMDGDTKKHLKLVKKYKD